MSEWLVRAAVVWMRRVEHLAAIDLEHTYHFEEAARLHTVLTVLFPLSTFNPSPLNLCDKHVTKGEEGVGRSKIRKLTSLLSGTFNSLINICTPSRKLLFLSLKTMFFEGVEFE